MSHNLTLSKTIKSQKKGEKAYLAEIDLRQTPTELTRECEKFLKERWRVFDAYRTWLENLRRHHKLPENLDDEHLNQVREALVDGYEWSWI